MADIRVLIVEDDPFIAMDIESAVAEQLGGVRRPWTVANESGRIDLSPASAGAMEPAA